MKRMMAALCAMAACAVGLADAAQAQDKPAAARAGPGRAYPDLLHVGIVVADIDEAVRSARARFGAEQLKVVSSFTLTAKDALYRGRTANYSAKFVIATVGNTDLEFIQPLGDDVSPYRDALKAHGDAPHHLAFAVPSIDAQLALARKDNPALTVVLDAAVPAAATRYVYVDGVIPGTLVEYVQRGGASAADGHAGH